MLRLNFEKKMLFCDIIYNNINKNIDFHISFLLQEINKQRVKYAQINITESLATMVNTGILPQNKATRFPVIVALNTSKK